jgi:hypothetical protein
VDFEAIAESTFATARTPMIIGLSSDPLDSGFRVASQKSGPVAGDISRCALPYTEWPRRNQKLQRVAVAGPGDEGVAQQALFGQERVLAVEHAVEGSVEVHTLGLAEPFGLAIPVGQLGVVEAAGVVEADPVVTHASVSSSGWG